MSHIQASADIPRELIIEWVRYGTDEQLFHAHCHAFLVVDGCSQSVAYGGAHAVAEMRLKYLEGHPVLCLTHAQFDLTASEAVEVERTFGPLGLRIERKEAK